MKPKIYYIGHRFATDDILRENGLPGSDERLCHLGRTGRCADYGEYSRTGHVYDRENAPGAVRDLQAEVRRLLRLRGEVVDRWVAIVAPYGVTLHYTWTAKTGAGVAV